MIMQCVFNVTSYAIVNFIVQIISNIIVHVITNIVANDFVMLFLMPLLKLSVTSTY